MALFKRPGASFFCLSLRRVPTIVWKLTGTSWILLQLFVIFGRGRTKYFSCFSWSRSHVKQPLPPVESAVSFFSFAAYFSYFDAASRCFPLPFLQILYFVVSLIGKKTGDTVVQNQHGIYNMRLDSKVFQSVK